ncbi:hypothetical protein GCM10010174_37750 [Kutzneria viridogrisea]|uniref:Uncharacterized protein n=1 Tax=Kutzneria albida DSM 43870 TaxID=1449976 RepID=W5W1H8_9PSEU|nr:hypothetical protein KALB_1299 [Kutzneria albida DSM 43870]
MVAGLSAPQRRAPVVEVPLARLRHEVGQLAEAVPAVLAEPVARAVAEVTDPRHRLRSELALSTVLALGAELDDRVFAAVAAVELVHAASLVPDGPGPHRLAAELLRARAGACALWVSHEVAEELAILQTDLVEAGCRELLAPYGDESSALLGSGGLFRAAVSVAARTAGVPDHHWAAVADYAAQVGAACEPVVRLLDVRAPSGSGTLVGDVLARCARRCERAGGQLSGPVTVLSVLPEAYLDWARTLFA